MCLYEAIRRVKNVPYRRESEGESEPKDDENERTCPRAEGFSKNQFSKLFKPAIPKVVMSSLFLFRFRARLFF